MEEITEAFLTEYEENTQFAEVCGACSPAFHQVARLVETLQILLFPDCFGTRDACAGDAAYIAMLVGEARYQLAQLLTPVCQVDGKTFLLRLPAIRRALALDLQAFLAGDPAANEAREVLFCYPGFYAIMVQRLAHLLHSMGVPLLPRMMTELAHSKTGIDIHPGAVLGPAFFIDHGTGVVIGETTVIGAGVKLYQGVTLGALSTKHAPALRGVKRHPTLEDGVTVYAGASILGGNTVIGAGAVIGANAFVTGSVEPGATVIGHRPGP